MTVIVANVSDMHAGSTLSACPPSVPLDDGGRYEASRIQQWYWQNWQNYWARVTECRREHKRAKLVVVFNGDVVEGDHHNTSQIVSRNPTTQAAILDAVLRIPLALKPDRIVFTRGTESHVGHSAACEEAVAAGLRSAGHPIVVDPDTESAAWWHCRYEIEGVLLDITHHGRTGQREHTRGGAAVLHAHDVFLSHTKRKERHPDLCFRAHYHRFNDSYDACPTRVITSGAWQAGLSGHVKKVAPDSVADCGGYIVTVDRGEYDVAKVDYPVARGAICRDV